MRLVRQIGLSQSWIKVSVGAATRIVHARAFSQAQPQDLHSDGIALVHQVALDVRGV